MAETKNPVRPEESIAKMIASLKETTGKSMDEWKSVIANRGWLKHGEIVSGIKADFGVSHGYANQIAIHARKSDEIAEVDPIEEMFAKRAEAKAVYEFLLPRIEALGGDIDLAPKKGYVSVRRKKQFAVLQPAAGRLDVGIQLKGVKPGSRLEASGSFNAMLTHRVRIATVADIDGELIGWITQAYEAAG